MTSEQDKLEILEELRAEVEKEMNILKKVYEDKQTAIQGKLLLLKKKLEDMNKMSSTIKDKMNEIKNIPSNNIVT